MKRGEFRTPEMVVPGSVHFPPWLTYVFSPRKRNVIATDVLGNMRLTISVLASMNLYPEMNGCNAGDGVMSRIVIEDAGLPKSYKDILVTGILVCVYGHSNNTPN